MFIRYIIMIAAVIVIMSVPGICGQNKSVSYRKAVAAGVSAHVITVDLRNPAVKVSVIVAAGNFPHSSERFTSMVHRAAPTAAINGTFFDKHSLRPIGDIVIDGLIVHQGLMGTALAITPDNKAIIRRVTRGHMENWSDYETVIACGPTLIRSGAVDLNTELEGFRDPHVLGSGCRSACGLTSDGRLLLVSIPKAITLRKLADVMLALGCMDAMNLDGGASVAMYYRGKVIVTPGRHLTNIITVYENGRHIPAQPTENENQQPITEPLPDTMFRDRSPVPSAATEF